MPATASLLDEHEHSAFDLLSGLPSWSRPAKEDAIVEPAYSSDQRQRLTAVRAAVRDRLRTNGLVASEQLKAAYSGFHWRDLYTLCADSTEVTPSTDDPRPTVDGVVDPLPAPSRSIDSLADYHVQQFLAASSLDVQRASVQLCDYLYWWSAFGMDDLCAQLVCPFADLATVFHAPRLHGVDQHGRPLLVGTPGAIRVQPFLALRLPRQWSWILQAYLRERIDRLLIDASAQRGLRITQFTAIADLSGISLDHRRLLPWATGGSYVASHFYPETTGCIAVINAPFFFPLVWRLVQRMVAERTRQKVAVLDGQYQPRLNALVGASHVPSEWAGKCAHCSR